MKPKIGSIAQILDTTNKLQHINKYRIINTAVTFTKKTTKGQGLEKTPLALGHTPLLSGEAG